MWEHRIKSLETRDLRFPLEHGTGSDAVHSGAEYVFAATLLHQRTGNIVLAALEHVQDHAN